MKQIAAATLLSLLAACSASEDDAGVSEVTADEAQALNDAAEMLGNDVIVQPTTNNTSPQ